MLTVGWVVTPWRSGGLPAQKEITQIRGQWTLSLSALKHLFLNNALENNFVAAFSFASPLICIQQQHMHVNISTYITSALFCTLRT